MPANAKRSPACSTAEECALLDDNYESESATDSASPGDSSALSGWVAIWFDRSDYNKNKLDKGKSLPWQEQLCAAAAATTKSSPKYVACSWRLLKRKQVLLLLGLVLVLLYVNVLGASGKDGADERIPVVHYSHVPGMKEGVGATAPNNTHTPTALELRPESARNLLLKNSFVSAADNKSTFAIETLIANDIAEIFSSLHTDHTDNSTMDANSMPNAVPNITLSPPPGYLVWSERCKMPNIDPYLPEVMTFFKREKYKPCSSTKPLTSVYFNASSQRYVLRIDEKSIKAYSKSKSIDCCYQSIERDAVGVRADKDISLSECMSFSKSTKLAPTINNVLVKCTAQKKTVYTNGHPMLPERPELRRHLDAWKEKDRKKKRHATSVLMLGIDSISRINLIRAMPKTAQYLYDREWFELSGYNKIDDNTFPNLMALLTGRNKTHAFSKCPPTVLRGLDNCSFVWNTFREHGYVTAYGEDEAEINTFNYLKLGFEQEPVDYYLRPFLLGAEKHLTIKRKSRLAYCLGYKHAAEFVYDYALELAARYKNDSYFGLYWTNSFSHNAISDCSAMDEKMVEYLEKFAALGTFNNTIVVFFSDHGIRFGPTRKTSSGHMEERLPFMFIWLPPHLKQSHPEFVNALNVNKNRLTNPYDLHMTLKHVLALSGRVVDQDLLRPAEDCPRCQSLLAPVPHNRSCDDVAIEDHWCTCIPYQNIYKNSKVVQKLAKATVTYINDFVVRQLGANSKLCVPLKFANVESAFRAQQFHKEHENESTNSSTETYRIIFRTKPNKALFEATVRYNERNGDLQVTGEISRLNSYGSDSECIGDGATKKYCSCHKKLF